MGCTETWKKYAFCYTLYMQQNLSAVLDRKAVPCSSSCARRCENALWFFKRCSDVSESHSCHTLALFCGAEEEERFAEMLAWSLVFKKAKKPKSVWNERDSLMQTQDIHSNRGT